MPPAKFPSKNRHVPPKEKGLRKFKNVQDVVDFAHSFAWQQSEALLSTNISLRFSRFILFIEVILSIVIIQNVSYTEIDWTAYMEEVGGFLNGTLDYSKLEGLKFLPIFIVRFQAVILQVELGRSFILLDSFICTAFFTSLRIREEISGWRSIFLPGFMWECWRLSSAFIANLNRCRRISCF